MTTDPRIDAYIARARPFARPILERVRAAVHRACPTVEETLKWGHPAFLYHGILCGMAAFKGHCAVNFWKGALLFPNDDPRSAEAMGQLGRLTTVKELPSAAAFQSLLKQAMRLNAEGVAVPKRRAAPRPELTEPDDLVRALKRSARARRTWEGFAPSHRREYVEWITEAKRDETRTRRLATTITWLEEGKRINWKYER
jgi:uncharacterized protein YdeI (YjbR/CyaY-like superfamily)